MTTPTTPGNLSPLERAAVDLHKFFEANMPPAEVIGTAQESEWPLSLICDDLDVLNELVSLFNNLQNQVNLRLP